MRLLDILSPDCIKVDLKAKNRRDAIAELMDMLAKCGKVKSKPKALDAVLEREKLMSTGIGQGVAIPHAKSDACSQLCAAFARSGKGIAFDSLDNKPVHLMFLLVSPEADTGMHISALARISRLLKHMVFKEALMSAKDPGEVYRIIEEEERKR